MINKKRVQRIKNLIYAFIILVLLLPLILVSILSFRLLRQIDNLVTKIDQLSVSVSSQAANSLPEGGYIIEPEGQSSGGSGIIPKTTEDSTQGEVGTNRVPNASESTSEANGAPSGNIQADMPSVGTGVISPTDDKEPPEEYSGSVRPVLDDTPPLPDIESVFDGSKQTPETGKPEVSVTKKPDGVNGNPKMGS